MTTIEDYLLSLGKLAVMVQMLKDEQKKYLKVGILNDDEVEILETIEYRCEQLIYLMGDQVRMVGERTPKTWDETMKDIKKELVK